MAQYSRIDVAVMAKATCIVPVFYNSDLEICKNIVKACFKGGARLFEFTNRGDFAHEIFSELSKYTIKEFPEMILGVGSVIEEATTALYIQLGANFIVSPILNKRMATICNRRKVAWIPGCGSLSEIGIAEELGAEIVKIFPASQVGGPDFIKAIKGPMKFTNIMPTGGVAPNEENLKNWFKSGAYCVGMGSQLMVRKEDGSFNYSRISQLVENSIRFADKYKIK